METPNPTLKYYMLYTLEEVQALLEENEKLKAKVELQSRQLRYLRSKIWGAPLVYRAPK